MKLTCLLALLGAFASGQPLLAGEAYYDLPTASLNFIEGSPPPNESGTPRNWNWNRSELMRPYAALDGEGEVYVESRPFQPWDPAFRIQGQSLVIRVAKERDITGRLMALKADGSSLVSLKFKVPASAAKREAKQRFYEVKAAYYRTLLNRGIPGGAWFRHMEQECLKELPGKTNRLMPGPDPFAWRRQSEWEQSYDLFSGGRAVSENLQLDRVLTVSASNLATVDLTNLAGITVREMDWKPLVKDLKPETDPLAACIPADQHALFFSSFKAMTALMDEADFHGTPVLQLLEPRAEDALTKQRYQKQLCLDLSDISRILGPYVLDSVAITGSDPYLRTGSDLGILFETKNATVLIAFLAAKHAAAIQANADVKAVQGELDGVAYTGAVLPDRSLCSYTASIGKIVFVSNSRYQLGQMIKAAQGKIPTMATLDEYRFFRQRYIRGDKEETAFLVLTDAAIRRWCGPRWRILSARRTQAAALMSELQAAHLDALARGTAQPGPLPTDLKLPEAGELRLTREGVASSVYGTLAFLTPIAEVPLTQVTQAEADAYNQWRNRYQQNWRQYFDPIAARFSVRAAQIGVDLTVMPLIAGTDYRDLIEIARGVKIAPGSGDPHTNALLHLALAINSESARVKEVGGSLGPTESPIKANLLGWLGPSLALYFDDDPFWSELRQSTNAPVTLERQFNRLPIGLWCGVKSPLGVAGFLTALRGKMNSTAPGMAVWQNLEYNSQPYVRVSSAPRAGAPGNDGDAFSRLAVYYAATPESLLVTLSEPLLKRALDRQAERAKSPADDPKTAGRPWLGESLCLQGDKRSLEVIQTILREQMTTTLQTLSWNNLPILNEWHRLYPNQDPAQLHEKYWQSKLVCPAGGTYVWNEPWQTMESTACGHPGEPKPVAADRFVLPKVTAANFGLTFENQGLRARAILEREAKTP